MSNSDPSKSDSDDLQDALLAAFGDEANDWLLEDDGQDDDQAAILAEKSGAKSGEGSFPGERALDAILTGLTAELETTSATSESASTEQSEADLEDVGPRHAVFEVGDQVFGIPLTGVREIDRCGKVTVLPRTPAWLRGVTNLRGQILSVTDFRNFCLLYTSPSPRDS